MKWKKKNVCEWFQFVQSQYFELLKLFEIIIQEKKKVITNVLVPNAKCKQLIKFSHSELMTPAFQT